jgi:predicted nucleic acid-binding protein
LTICHTNTLFTEYRDVFLREKNLMAFDLVEQDISIFLNALLSLADHRDVYYLLRPNLIDENDNMVLECAVASQSQYLVTANIKDFIHAELREMNFKVLTPSKFMKMWRSIK